MERTVCYGNIHICSRQWPEPIVFYCASPIPCTCPGPGPVPVQCDYHKGVPEMFTLVQDSGTDQDPLFSIVPVPIPVPAVPFLWGNTRESPFTFIKYFAAVELPMLVLLFRSITVSNHAELIWPLWSIMFVLHFTRTTCTCLQAIICFQDMSIIHSLSSKAIGYSFQKNSSWVSHNWKFEPSSQNYWSF